MPKRMIDIVCSLVLLLILSPFLAVVMVILRFTGERKVFFLQERIGYKGEHFDVFKFATMVENSPNIGTQDITLPNDPRVLPFGKFLRKVKLNEVPQLINILIGDMSFVGWRPLMPVSFALYSDEIQKEIVKIKPGLTGLASIVFRDEERIVHESSRDPREVYSDLIAPYKGKLELWYQERQSLWLDALIVILSAWVVILPKTEIVFRILKTMPHLRKLLKNF